MRIVIAGAGKLGFSIAQLLAEDQFDVVVVEIDPKRKDVIQNTLDVLAIEGNSCNPTTLLILISVLPMCLSPAQIVMK